MSRSDIKLVLTGSAGSEWGAVIVFRPISLQTPDDWPFQTLKLGEYFALARQASKVVCEQQVDFADAVDEVVAGRSVTDRERSMLIQKTRSIVYLGLNDG